MSFCLPLPGFHSSVKLVVSVYFMAVTLFHTGPLLITVYCHRSCNVMAAAFFSSGSDFVLFLCQMYVNECSVSEFLLLFPLLSSSWIVPLVTLPEVNTHTHRCLLPIRWSMSRDESGAALRSCRAQRAQCVGRWVWSRWHTHSRPPRLMKSAWRAKCLSSEWTWTYRSHIVRTGKLWSCEEKTQEMFLVLQWTLILHQLLFRLNECSPINIWASVWMMLHPGVHIGD